MSIQKNSSHRTRNYLLIGLAPAALIVAAMAANEALASRATLWLTPAGKLVNTPLGSIATVSSPALSAVQNSSADKRVETEVITIRPTGFEPAQISRPQGRFLLAINNRSGLQEITLNLDREAGNRLPKKQKPKGKSRWSEVMDLPPGRYILAESNHPKWVCKITITAR